MIMYHHLVSLAHDLKNNAYDYISLAQSPAEVDMLRFLTIYSLSSNGAILNHKNLPRLKNYTPWDFYNVLYDADYTQSSDIVHKISEKFTHLKFENELSLNPSEKNLSPYHPMLNNLPPLILHDTIIDFQALRCFKITQAQPYLNLDFRYCVTEDDLKHKIHELNTITDRNARLNTMVYVQRIKDHDFFNDLNGQRGVFAKTDIPAGTIIDYYSGEYTAYPAPMPPLLCTWRVQKSLSYLDYLWKYRKISRFSGWTDAFILGNMMKLVNSCYSQHTVISDIGNIGCYFFHFKSKGFYVSLPVYVAIKDITKDSELLTFYHVGHYKNNRVYGVE
jgi:hypothetical protein